MNTLCHNCCFSVYVHGVVGMSGSSLAPWALTKSARSATLDLAANISCPLDSTTNIVNCLKEKDAAELLETANRVSQDFKVV